jgi:hypothetical protein
VIKYGATPAIITVVKPRIRRFLYFNLFATGPANKHPGTDVNVGREITSIIMVSDKAGKAAAMLAIAGLRLSFMAMLQNIDRIAIRVKALTLFFIVPPKKVQSR